MDVNKLFSYIETSSNANTLISDLLLITIENNDLEMFSHLRKKVKLYERTTIFKITKADKLPFIVDILTNCSNRDIMVQAIIPFASNEVIESLTETFPDAFTEEGLKTILSHRNIDIHVSKEILEEKFRLIITKLNMTVTKVLFSCFDVFTSFFLKFMIDKCPNATDCISECDVQNLIDCGKYAHLRVILENTQVQLTKMPRNLDGSFKELVESHIVESLIEPKQLCDFMSSEFVSAVINNDMEQLKEIIKICTCPSSMNEKWNRKLLIQLLSFAILTQKSEAIIELSKYLSLYKFNALKYATKLGLTVSVQTILSCDTECKENEEELIGDSEDHDKLHVARKPKTQHMADAN